MAKDFWYEKEVQSSNNICLSYEPINYINKDWVNQNEFHLFNLSNGTIIYAEELYPKKC